MRYFFIFSLLFVWSMTGCRKENNIPKKITVTGQVTDSLTQTAVRGVQVHRSISYWGLCWGISSLSQCWTSDYTHTSSVDSLGNYHLSIPTDSIQNGQIHLDVSQYGIYGTYYNGYGVLIGTHSTVPVVLSEDIQKVDLKVKVIPALAIHLQDDPNVKFLPSDGKWKCTVFQEVNGKQITVADLSLKDKGDTVIIKHYEQQVQLFWKFTSPHNYQPALYGTGADSLPSLQTNKMTHYNIKY